MTSLRIPMTVDGEKRLRTELQELKKVARPKIIEEIAEARKQGDLKENAEYQFAREKQSFIEGKITELEAKVFNAQIIDVRKIINTGKVIFGSTVKLLNVKTKKAIKYKIVGDDEADIKVNLISISSPLSRALIGKTENTTIKLATPNGTAEYKIISVEYT